ncbi:hypothetical protein N7517_005038 [Penicillium concentricum]|uniref:Myb-like domain-containing protein n=1 Tax=Penicillium concentricum TaxID=293559 RepID=A0A9W9V8U0_9EURO|nr:uncharacterized protein N7517_005038 [Penicillium concentricum]KAJ5373032.1 hypothetical protein N7517_005038 [Penicillium concentricum]
MAHSWDHERDKQLLVAILAVHSPLDFAAIAKAMGQGDSTAAVKNHVYTLKTRLGAGPAQSNTNDKADKPSGRDRKATKSPSKRKTATANKPEKDPVVESQGGDGDGDESGGSPTKQRKL